MVFITSASNTSDRFFIIMFTKKRYINLGSSRTQLKNKISILVSASTLFYLLYVYIAFQQLITVTNQQFRTKFQKHVTRMFGSVKSLCMMLSPDNYELCSKEKTRVFESAVLKSLAPLNDTASSHVPTNDSLKIILMWNEWNERMADEPLSKIQCPKKNCLFTTDMSLILQSDVVVLHFDTLNEFPVNRLPHQRFVFYQFESPENTASELMDDPRFRFDYFNWTMTYRRDSDIFLRDYYGSLVSKLSNNNNTREMRYKYETIVKGQIMEINGDPLTELSNYSLGLSELIRHKTKMIMWLVGNCITVIRREEYVRQLSQYVSVDIFGRCNRDCPSNCDEMVRKDYKFYLAFENSWCPDYITEKFSRPLLFDAVPIVLGGADYNLFAPPHSYINARDFSSPKDLAEYIILLNKTDSLYASYFNWKNEYYISVPDMYGWCELCVMAHTSNLPSKVYHDIKQWWMEDGGKCIANTTDHF